MDRVRVDRARDGHDRTRQLCPGMHTSIYCGGLGIKDASGEFVFATAQSIAKNCSALGHRDLVLVDEAHQVPARSESQYQKIMAELSDINPGVRLSFKITLNSELSLLLPLHLPLAKASLLYKIYKL